MAGAPGDGQCRARGAETPPPWRLPPFRPREIYDFAGLPKVRPDPFVGRGPAVILAAPGEFGGLPAVVGDGAGLRRFVCDSRLIADDAARVAACCVRGPASTCASFLSSVM